MASLVRRHPRAAMLVAVATCIICLPILLPLFLIFSPFLLLSSLFSMGLRTLLRSLLRMMRLSFDFPPRRITSNKRRNEANESYGSFEGGRIKEEGSLRQSRVHEYLEDQLKNLNVVAFGRTESGEDLLPCSFSFGSDDHLESLNVTLPWHGEG